MQYTPSDVLIESALRQVEEQVRSARRQLRRRVRNAKAPLDVWERDGGIHGIKGQVLVVRGRGINADQIALSAQGQGFNADIAGSVREALSLLRIAKYDMVITAMRSRGGGGWRLIQDIRRNFPGIRVVPFVSNADEGREFMRQGVYSYLLPNHEMDQVSTCILSGLHLHRRVCQTLLRGDPCDRSCVANFMREGELDDFVAPAPLEPPLPEEEQIQPHEVAYYQRVEE